MTVTDRWKIFKNVDKHLLAIFKYTDMLAGDMMNCAEEINENEPNLP